MKIDISDYGVASLMVYCVLPSTLQTCIALLLATQKARTEVDRRRQVESDFDDVTETLRLANLDLARLNRRQPVTMEVVAPRHSRILNNLHGQSR
jgi:hypothetical protein